MSIFQNFWTSTTRANPSRSFSKNCLGLLSSSTSSSCLARQARDDVGVEELANRATIVNSGDGLGEDLRDQEDLDLFRVLMGLQRHGVRDDDLVEEGAVDSLDGASAKDGMGRRGEHLGRAALAQKVRRLHEGAAACDLIVDDDGDLALHVSNEL